MLKRVAVSFLLILCVDSASLCAQEANSEVDWISGVEFKSKKELSGVVTLDSRKKTTAVRASDVVLEEILQELASDKKITLQFYCWDPSEDQTKVSIKTKPRTLPMLLRQLLGYQRDLDFLDAGGDAVEDEPKTGIVRVYPKDCPKASSPVRVIRPLKGHSVFSETLFSKSAGKLDLQAFDGVLSSEGPGARRYALKFLRKSTDEAAFSLLLKALEDPNDKVMLDAADVIAVSRYENGAGVAAEAIYRKLERKPYLELALDLARLDRQKAWPVIHAMTESVEDEVKKAAVEAIAITGDERALDWLLAQASTDNLDIATNAIAVIPKIGSSDAAAGLVRFLRDEETWRRAWAAKAIIGFAGTHGRDAQKELAKMVHQEEVPDEVLEVLVQSSHLQPLEDLLRDDSAKPTLKINALRAMGTAGSSNTVETLAVGLEDRTPAVRLAAIKALSFLATDNVLPHLLGAIEDEDPKVRAAAAQGLSEFFAEDTPIVAALSKMLDDPDKAVRKAAIDALSDLGKPKDVLLSVLRSSLGHKDPYVSKKAASTLKYWHLDAGD